MLGELMRSNSNEDDIDEKEHLRCKRQKKDRGT